MTEKNPNWREMTRCPQCGAEKRITGLGERPRTVTLECGHVTRRPVYYHHLPPEEQP
jgi:PHP family Zn ribbon phosphoesterase